MNRSINAKGAAASHASILLHFVVVAVGFASLSAFQGRVSSGLSLRLRTSAPCVNAKADAGAGPFADADADAS